MMKEFDEKFELYKKKEKRDFTRLDFVFFFLQIMLHISIYREVYFLKIILFEDLTIPN